MYVNESVACGIAAKVRLQTIRQPLYSMGKLLYGLVEDLDVAQLARGGESLELNETQEQLGMLKFKVKLLCVVRLDSA